MAKKRSDEPLTCPFVVLADNREQGQWHFHGIRADARYKYRPVTVDVRRVRLQTGDYTLEADGEDYRDRFSVERKSIADLFQTLGRGRKRFRDEMRRMEELDHSFVVVEASLFDILLHPPRWSKVPGKTIYRTILSWQMEFPKTHWLLCDNRRMAEVTCFRILEKAYQRTKR